MLVLAEFKLLLLIAYGGEKLHDVFDMYFLSENLLKLSPVFHSNFEVFLKALKVNSITALVILLKLLNK